MSHRSWRAGGIDVSAENVDITFERDGEHHRRSFHNTPAGHRQLIAALTRGGGCVRVALEATGTYYLDLATALAETPGVEVMVINPRKLRHYAKASGRRAKTDPLDADLIFDYLLRMDFVAWKPTPAHRLELKALSRRVSQLVHMRTQEVNRLHATSATRQHPSEVADDLRAHIEQLDQRIDTLRRLADARIQQDAELKRQRDLLLSIHGVGEACSLAILGEVCTLPDGLSVRQWVAFAGLDPKISQSGNRAKKPKISREGNAYLRRALYMPILCANYRQPHFRDFYQRLLDRGKLKRVAQVATMRKLLHAVYGILKNDSPFDPDLLFPNAQLDDNAA